MRRDAERYSLKDDHMALKKKVREKNSSMSINATNRRLSQRRKGNENDDSDSTASAWHYSSSLLLEIFIDFKLCVLFSWISCCIIAKPCILVHISDLGHLFLCAREGVSLSVCMRECNCLFFQLFQTFMFQWCCMIVSILRPVGRKLRAGTRNTQNARGEDRREL